MMIRSLRWISLVLATVVPSLAHAAIVPVTLDFENVGGNIPGSPGNGGYLVNIATTTTTINGVTFQVPSGEPIFAFGPYSQPFVTKSIGLWTFGPQGLTIPSPQPITHPS